MSIPQTIGPFNSTSTPALSAGTAFAFSINNDAIAIQVHNDSPYRCYVAFDGARPTASVAQLGSYQGVVGPWAHPVITVRTQGGGPFFGTVWIMPVNVTTFLAQTGSVSQLAEIHVDVYMPGDELPQSWAMPRQQDVTSQARSVIVPMSLSHFYQNTWSGVGTTLVANLIPTADQITAGFAPIYLYYANVMPEAHTGDTEFVIQLQWQTGGGVNVGSPFIFARGLVFAHATNFTATGWTFAPVFPFGAVGSMPATAAQAAIQMANAGGTPISVAYTIAVHMDPTNIAGPREIGVAPYNGTSQPLF